MYSFRPFMLREAQRQRALFRIFGAPAFAFALLSCDGREQVQPEEDAREGRSSRSRVGDEQPSVPVPESEFVVSAGDSTFWIRTGEAGISMRSSPLLLARAGDRYFELYVTDQDQSFSDAVFTGQQLWRRDLVTNDSTVVFSDSLVIELARRWAAENPQSSGRQPDDHGHREPLASASGELAVLDVVGPFVSYEWFSDVHPPGGPPTHRLHRGVFDVRTGRPVPLASLVGDSAARSLEREGVLLLATTADSLSEDGIVASDFVFDPGSFSLGVADGAPVVAFLAPSRTGSPGEAGGLPLSGIPMRPLSWWDKVRQERALEPSEGAQDERWALGNDLELVVRREVEGDVALLLRSVSEPVAAPSEPETDGGPAEWVIGHVTPPVQRIYGLDRPPVRDDIREALTRAFDDAARYKSPAPPAPIPPRRIASRSEGAATLNLVSTH